MRLSHSALSAGLVAAVSTIVLAGCSGVGGALSGPTPSVSGGTGSTTPAGTASPGSSDTASPSADSASPATPDASTTPTVAATAAPSSSGSPLPSGTPSPTGARAPSATCTEVTPIRVEKLTTEPRRTTEVVTVVSDGRNITSGTREQSEFLVPTLEGPEGTEISDEATMRKVATLITSSAKNRVLLTRPDAPDARSDANRPPFNAPGTYVVFHSSTPLDADVIVQCSGQEQRWTFTAESDPTSGQVNCAVEPPKSSAIARLVYQNNC